jgi:F-type H+-transporting ATPase subunit epsilon
MKTFDLQIITPRGTFYHGKSSIITLKISEGEIGLMADRLPLMSSVKVSNFVVRDEDGKERHCVIGNGIVQTNRDEITIIVRDVI